MQELGNKELTGIYPHGGMITETEHFLYPHGCGLMVITMELLSAINLMIQDVC